MRIMQIFTVRDEHGEEFDVTAYAPPRKARARVEELCRENGWNLINPIKEEAKPDAKVY